MIELQTALVIAGIVLFIIIVIISYDRYRLMRIKERESRLREIDAEWQEPMLVRREEVEDNPAVPGDDDHYVLSPEASEIEPSLSLDVDDFDRELRDAEDVALTPIHGTEIRVTEHVHAADESVQIDFVARIPGKNIIKRDTALGLYRQFEFDLKKPRRIFGFTHPSQVWADLERESETARFTHFGMTLQLADRHGPVTESDLNRFSQMVLRFSEVFGRRFSFSTSFDEALKQAAFLDEFCKKFDALAILNVLTDGGRGFSGIDIDRHAQELGMEFSGRNYYQKVRRSGVRTGRLYGLANLFGNGEIELENEEFRTDGLTLFMNIPATKRPVDTFREMVTDAKSLCDRLGGKLVDQNRKPMSDRGLEQISQQIRKIELEMEQEHVPSGGDIAVRLF